MSYTVYGRANCVWCEKAKDLLTKENLPFVYVELAGPQLKTFFTDRPNLPRTVPQIYHGEKHVGGYDKLLDYLAFLET